MKEQRNRPNIAEWILAIIAILGLALEMIFEIIDRLM
jgi:hypothetical protein